MSNLNGSFLSDDAQKKLSSNNIFLIAKRNVEGQVCLSTAIIHIGRRALRAQGFVACHYMSRYSGMPDLGKSSLAAISRMVHMYH